MKHLLSIGQTAYIALLSHLIFVFLAWRLLQFINLDTLFSKRRVGEAQVLLLFVAIAIGTGVSRFVLDIMQNLQEIVFLA